MINPDTSAILNGDTIVVDNLADCKVAKDNIRRINDRDTCSSNFGAFTNTNN